MVPFFEGGPLVLLEALAADLPIITTNTGFADIFANQQGVTLVEPPVDIFKFKGPISHLRSSSAFEHRLAAEMKNLVKDPVRPKINDDVIAAFDKKVSYLPYVDIVEKLMNGIALNQENFNTWPTRFSELGAGQR